MEALFYLTSPINHLLGILGPRRSVAGLPPGLVRHGAGDPGRRLGLGGIGLQAGGLGPQTLRLGRQILGPALEVPATPRRGGRVGGLVGLGAGARLSPASAWKRAERSPA